MVSSRRGKEVVIVARKVSSAGGFDRSQDSANWLMARASNDCCDTIVPAWLSEFVMASIQSPFNDS